MEFLSEIYPWTKALHIISMVAWRAAMLYLPRLFVYHAGVVCDRLDGVLADVAIAHHSQPHSPNLRVS